MKNRWPIYEILLILIVCVLAFGILLPSLGFYWDDWPVVFLAEAMGTDGYQGFYQYDRPFSAWTYILMIPLLGVAPIKWHIFTFLLRFLTVVLFYYVVKAVWPERPSRAIFAALLFAIYPTFFQQSIAVAYSQHFITYALFMASLLAMIVSVRKPKYFWPLMIFALLAEMLHLFTMEYMLGLELLRLPILWILLSGQARRLKQTIWRGAPYLAGLSIFVIWRMFFLQLPEDPNAPEFLYQLVETPLSALIGLAETVVQNVVYMLVTAWAGVLDITDFDFTDRFLLLSWGIVALTFGILWFSLNKLLSSSQVKSIQEDDWMSGVWLGLFAVIAGFVPTWIVGKKLLVGLYSDRLSLPVMFGAALLLAVLIEVVIRTLPQRIVLVSLLVALAVGAHVRVANEYRWDWVKQERFFAQVQTRAPALEPNTALVAEGAVSQYVSQYVASTALNTIYGTTTKTMSTWYFEFYRSGFDADIAAFNEGHPIKESIRDLMFEGNSAKRVLVVYQPEIAACVWMLTPLDVANLQIPEALRIAAAGSNGELPVLTGSPAVWPQEIFGELETDNWCSIYQQASLAVQVQDWEQVSWLFEIAEGAGYRPQQGYEYIPFIQAFSEQDEWARASQTTIKAYKQSFQAQSILCYVWEQYTVDYAGQIDFEQAYQQVDEKVVCHGQ